ncbi:MAG: hypothetical protein HY264_10315 [Chloroflexi bacterium]|nr:hypothetical protein [Chloroflexota bacterium]
MEKTTVYLTTEQKAALAATARAQGRSEARLIRDGIEEVLAGHVAREAPASVADQPGHEVSRRDELGVRPRWVSREAFVGQFVDAQADAALNAELRDLAPDMTDELPDR